MADSQAGGDCCFQGEHWDWESPQGDPAPGLYVRPDIDQATESPDIAGIFVSEAAYFRYQTFQVSLRVKHHGIIF